MTGKKKIWGMILCIALVFTSVFFVGCNDSEANQGGEQDGEISGKEYTVQLYYVNEEYVNEGDEALGYFKAPVEKKISAEPEAIYAETLKALVEKPEEEGYTTMVKNNIKINGVALNEDGKTVTVDFESHGLSGGSTEETLLVEQVVWTLTKSFEEVKQVKFTVDGAPAESLMGHLDAAVPYSIIDVDDGSGKLVETVMPIYE